MESVKGPSGVSPNLESSLGQLSKFGELIGTALQISLETPLGCPVWSGGPLWRPSPEVEGAGSAFL